ncbi:hypothetical protein [uncultured Jatrophihabitans sp.]|uniref:hypothetical protein n=1 Tax=uncultured Jatrophihabitans sp. TaxID=1610747 RepID=UPI0035C9E29C
MAVALVAIVIILYLVGKSSDKSTSGDGGYAGWRTSITNTTCVQWDDDMTGAQRFAMSQEMIRRLDAKDKSDDYARSFVGDVTNACQPRVDTVGDIAAGIATIATGDFN